MNEGGLAYVLCLATFCFSFGGNGGADYIECGREVGRRVVEGGAGVANGNGHELDTS